MAIPKYNELYSLFLFAIQDGAPHSSKDVKKIISQKLHFNLVIYQDRIMRSFANSPPLAIWNFASRSETCRFFFSSPETS